MSNIERGDVIFFSLAPVPTGLTTEKPAVVLNPNLPPGPDTLSIAEIIREQPRFQDELGDPRTIHRQHITRHIVGSHWGLARVLDAYRHRNVPPAYLRGIESGWNAASGRRIKFP